MFAFGLPYALVAAVAAGLLIIVPLVGNYLALVRAVLINLVERPDSTLFMLIVLAIIQGLYLNLLAPRIMAHAVGITRWSPQPRSWCSGRWAASGAPSSAFRSPPPSANWSRPPCACCKATWTGRTPPARRRCLPSRRTRTHQSNEAIRNRGLSVADHDGASIALPGGGLAPASTPKLKKGLTIMAVSEVRPGSRWAALLGRVKQSLAASAGDIVFGMEDGTVLIFGLVFGVAASSTSSAPVLLAGATGAVAAAVSMMAGAFLDVQTSRSIARAAMAREQQELQDHPEEERQEILDRLGQQGFSSQDARDILAILQRTPEALLQFEVAFEAEVGRHREQIRSPTPPGCS